LHSDQNNGSSKKHRTLVNKSVISAVTQKKLA